MRTFKKILIGIVFLFLVALVAAVVFYRSLLPTYDGTLKISSLESETTVYYDDYGIPHIYASTNIDAMTALGYVHAQDRLWQMELLRRIAPGRLSEIFGEKMIKNDMFFKSLGIEEYSQKATEEIDMDSEIYGLVNAYINGVNEFISNGPTPIEFHLLGLEKEKYQLKDMYNIIGYMSFSFAMAHKSDPLFSALYEKLGDDYLNEFDFNSNGKTEQIHNYKSDTSNFEGMVTDIHTITDNLPLPMFIGSNSWVISPEKTATGKVLFANDPHIGFAQPAVWFEAHVNTPTFEIYGYHLAGIPFPLLGHNRNFAYGLTMFENDDIDFFKEEVHPTNANEYKMGESFMPFSIHEKTIKVKDADDITFTYRTTKHGPVMNDVLETVSETSPISMSWIYTQHKGNLLKAIYSISRATSIDDVRQGASMIHAPGLNVMYGDAKGNVAWWASAKLYKYRENVNTKMILDGSSGTNEIEEYLDFSNNPMAENPSWKYVYSANNQPDSIANMLYPGYYLPEDRAKRIVTLLENKNDWTRNDVVDMINDVTSSTSAELVSEIEKNVLTDSLSDKENEALAILKNWNGNNDVDEIAPTLFNSFIENMLRNTFEDEMGEKLFTQFLKTHLAKREIAHQIFKENSIWWDNVTSETIETRKQIFTNSFKESIHFLETRLGADRNNWQWKNVHTLEHQHPLGTVASLRGIFNVGPFSINGSREVINNLAFEYNYDGKYQVNAGPSTRRVIDFSDVENSVSILPTGQSGNPFSKFYKNQAQLYVNGKFRKMKLNKSEIMNVSTTLTLQPSNE